MIHKISMSPQFWRKMLKTVEANPIKNVVLSLAGKTIIYSEPAGNVLFDIEAKKFEEVVTCSVTPLSEITDKELADKLSALINTADEQKNDLLS
jgi:hypothetical protein